MSPKNTLSAIVNVLNRAGSWSTHEIELYLSAGFIFFTLPPFIRISPSAGSSIPVSSLINVVLPAPFSPTNATFSPPLIVKLAFFIRYSSVRG
jgi:hypothetical protein